MLRQLDSWPQMDRIDIIDQEPALFHQILDYVITGEILLPPSAYDKLKLFQEARYYGATGLEDMVRHSNSIIFDDFYGFL
jgi:hypothetical protein